MTQIARFFIWIGKKITIGVVMAVLGVATLSLWVFLRDNLDLESRRVELMRTLSGERSHIESALADVEQRMATTQVELLKEQSRVEAAVTEIDGIRAKQTLWQRWFGGEDVRQAEARIATLEQQRRESEAAIARCKTTLQRSGWEREGLALALDKNRKQNEVVARETSRVMHYVRTAWEKYKWHVTIALAVYFIGPIVLALISYYFMARFIAHGKPIRFAGSNGPLPKVVGAGVSVDQRIAPGERLWVKESFLQASDEGLRRKTKFVLNWKIPVTSLACGLIELLEMRNDSEATTYRVTFSHQDDPNAEITALALAGGGSLMLRPSCLKGVIVPAGGKLEIRTHWRFFKWQSWLTLQFRFFEFAGPCTLLVAGSRGVRVEMLQPDEGNPSPARRTNQDATLGFSPALNYRPVRAETFWSYFRGQNPLFDDLFEGEGVFLCQETSAKGEAAGARRFWAGLWGGMLRVFGV